MLHQLTWKALPTEPIEERAQGRGAAAHHPSDPLEVLLKVLIPVSVAISDGDPTVVRAQQRCHAQWQPPRQLSLRAMSQDHVQMYTLSA